MVLVEVKDPCNEGLGRNMYTTYCVAGPNTMVRRRYSDFQWLYSRLQTELPGAIIPIIPHKRALGNTKKFNPELIEERRHNLQTFLHGVVAHPELSRAPSMTPFMTAAQDSFDVAKKHLETSKPSVLHPEMDQNPDGGASTASAAKKGFTNFLAKAKTLTQLSTGKASLLSTADEKQFEAIKKYVDEVETHAKQLVAASTALLKVTEDTASAVGALKEPMAGWKTTHQNSIKHGDDTLDMMSALLEFSTDYATLMEVKHREEQDQFETSIQQLSLDIKAFSNALKQRKHWQVTYTTKFQQIIDKDAALEKATKALKPPEVTDKLKAEKATLLKEADAAKATLEDCTQRVIREAHRVEPLLGVSLKECFRLYAKIQVDYHNRITDAWSQLLPYVGITEPITKTNANAGESSPSKEESSPVDEEPTPPEPSAPPPPPPSEE